LEEPKGKTLLVLISSKPDMLLPTIASRCQKLKFFKPQNLPQNPEKAEKNKAILDDLLLIVNSDLADKFKYTKALDFEKTKIGDILEVIQNYFRSQLLSSLRGAEATKQSDLIKKLKKNLELTQEISNKMLFTNANPKLALEILLMEL
jgi:DNA polymerase III delta prime subunit